jgi:hypothetical protein
MADVTVPTAPALSRIPNVELMHTGTWLASTGEFTCTTDDLLAAVAALDCPAVRRAGVKIGHTDPRFDGEPNVGYIDNLAVAENGRTLVGDYAGMPGWLADVLPSAWPDRSVEASYDFRCQMGHVHPFVLTAVALLGVARPGVGTLESLQDVAALYGIAAAAPESGTPVRITVHAKEQPMPSPKPQQIAATVTTEDVRRAFYASPEGQSDYLWIEEMQLDPPQLIVINDASGTRTRVPVTIGDGDGEEAVSFGDPVPVLIQYVDKASPSGVAASTARAGSLVFASRAESRPDTTPQTPAASAGGPPEQEGAPVVTDEELTTLRTELGLADDASFPDVLAAVKASKQPQTSPEGEPPDGDQTGDEPPAAPEAVSADTAVAAAVAAAIEPWKRQVEQSTAELARINAKAAADKKEAVIKAALGTGRIAPADREAWEKRYDKHPEVVEEVLAATAEGSAVPVAMLGEPGGEEDTAFDADYQALFGDEKVGA